MSLPDVLLCLGNIGGSEGSIHRVQGHEGLGNFRVGFKWSFGLDDDISQARSVAQFTTLLVFSWSSICNLHSIMLIICIAILQLHTYLKHLSFFLPATARSIQVYFVVGGFLASPPCSFSGKCLDSSKTRTTAAAKCIPSCNRAVCGGEIV